MGESLIKQALLIASCMLLPACSGFLNNEYAAELASPLDATATTGSLILSVGSLESCHPSLNTTTQLLIFPADDSFFRLDVAAMDVNSTFMDSEFEDHHGHLYVLKLPVGKYYLTPRSSNPFGGYLSPPRADFEVNAKETIYLGEFYMANECGQRVQMLLRDQEVRDLTVLKSKNSAFSNVKITKRLLAFTGCDRFSIFC